MFNEPSRKNNVKSLSMEISEAVIEEIVLENIVNRYTVGFEKFSVFSCACFGVFNANGMRPNLSRSLTKNDPGALPISRTVF